MSDWKERLGMVYSTNPDFEYTTSREEEPTTLPPQQQALRVWIDRKHRGGKTVTLVKGFVGMLKSKCGVGGSAKDVEIIIQGDHRERVVELLTKAGYGCKKAGN